MMNRMLLQKVGGEPSPFQDAFVAYSLRDLGLGANEVVIVQRASNNDFDGFTPTQITDGSLTSFCNGLGTVREWIDQKGNNNAVQLNSNSQPEIVDVNGNLIFENSLPSISFNGVNHFLDTQTVIQRISSIVQIYNIDNSSNGLNGAIDNSNNYRQYWGKSTSNNRHASGYGDINRDGFEGTVVNNTDLLIVVWDGVSAYMYVNNMLVNEVTPNTIGVTLLTAYIGLINGANLFLQQKQQELIIFQKDITTEINEIQSNINNYYNIF